MKTAIPQFLVVLLIVCVGSLRNAQAVSPPPDGGYPGFNTAEGENALNSLTTGGMKNTALGFNALLSNSTGDSNTATGCEALQNNTTGFANVAIGAQSLFNNAEGTQNVAIGNGALFNGTTANYNTAIGFEALERSNAQFNTAIGCAALGTNTSGHRNTAIGFNVLSNSSGSDNIALGSGAGRNVKTADGVICIGDPGANISNTCFIGNIRGVRTQNANALPVVIDGAGQLGTVASSERFKKNIANMGQASEGILSLRPVTFHYKTDTEDNPQFGLIAEEVAKINPALVVPDKEGKPYTVRYDAVNAMLLNEFLKEHRKVQELEATIEKQQKDFQVTATHQQKQIEALTAGLQTVRAQFEVSKAALQTVVNRQ